MKAGATGDAGAARGDDPRALAPARSPRKLLRRLWRAGAAGLVVIVLVALLHPLWLPPALRALAGPLGRRAGYAVEIDAIGRASWRGLEVSGVRVRPLGTTSPLRRLALEGATVEFDLLRLLRAGLDGVRRADLDGLDLALDLSAPSEGGEQASPAAELPARLPPAHLADARLALTLAGGREVRIEALDARTRAARIETRATGVRLALGPRPFEARSLELRAGWDGARLADLTLDVDGERWLRRAWLDIAALNRGMLEGFAASGDLPLERLAALAPGGPPAGGSARAQARLSAPLTAPLEGEGSATVRAWGVAVGAHAPCDLDLRVTLAGGRLALPAFEVRRGDGRIALADLELDLTAGQPLALVRGARSVEIELENAPALAAELGLAPEGIATADLEPARVSVQGSWRAPQFYFDALSWRQPSASFSGSGLVLDLAQASEPRVAGRLALEVGDLARALAPFLAAPPSGRLAGTVAIEGPLRAPELEIDLAAEKIAAGSLLAGQLSVRGSAAGPLDDPRAELVLEGESLRSGTSVAAERVHARARLEGTRLAVSELRADLAGAALRASGSFDLAARRIERADLTAEIEALERLAPQAGLVGTGDLSATLAGPLAAPEGTLALSAQAGPPGSAPLTVVLTARADPRSLVLSELRFEREGQRLALAAPARIERVAAGARCEGLRLAGEGIEFDLLGEAGPERIDLALGVRAEDLGALAPDLLPLPSPGDRLEGRLAIDARLEGTPRAPRGALSLEAAGLGGTWRGTALPLEGAALSLRADLLDDATRARLRLVEGARELASASGILERALAPAELAEGGLAALADAPLAADVRVAIADLGERLARLEAAGLPRIPLREGGLEARGRLDGTLAEPRWSASASLTRGYLRASPHLPPVRDFSVRLERAADGAGRVEARGELGGAPLECTGTFSLEDTPTAALRLSGKDLLLFRDRGVKARADLDLSLEGPLERARLQGTVNLVDVVYARDIDPLAFEPGRPRPAGPRGLALFSIRAAPLAAWTLDVAVRAKERVRIANNVVRGVARPELRLTGTLEVPVLLGTVYLDRTELSLPSGRLTFEAGTLRFLEEDPFVPRLALTGGARLFGYDVFAAVQGPYDAPEVTLSSTPPLSERELLLLVLAGRRPASSGGAGAQRTVALFLAKDFLTRWLSSESTDSDESLLERFELVTGRDVTRRGVETVEASFRLADGVLADRDALYLVAERDVYDEFNYGLRLVFRFR